MGFCNVRTALSLLLHIQQQVFGGFKLKLSSLPLYLRLAHARASGHKSVDTPTDSQVGLSALECQEGIAQNFLH